MRIAFLADACSVHIQRWIEFFNSQGDQTYLISLEKPAQEVTETFWLRPKFKQNLIKYWAAGKEVRDLLKRITPDLVNGHFVPNYGLLGARSKIRPLVVSVWGSDILISAKKSRLHRMRASWVLKQADWLTSDSYYLTEEMKKLGAASDGVSTFPMGVEKDFFLGAGKKVSSKEQITLVSYRRLEPIYNLDLLVDAIPMIISQTKRKLKFVIAGEGFQRRDLESRADRLGLSGLVEFTGSLSKRQLVELLHSADIYVSTSLSDSTSVSLLEALAAGLIPIVTDIAGNREWIRDGENGFLVPANKPEILAERVLWVCRNLENLQNVIHKNLERVKQSANYVDNLGKLREKFQELIRQVRSAR
jgi:glycosyltransferase involved in cell wall biosynthesis